jgi:nitroreductase
MDLVEAVSTRKTIRAFKPDPVPLPILKQIMQSALNSPSWANTQPWEFAIVSGDKLAEIKKRYQARGEASPVMDVARPRDFPEPYISRIRSIGRKEYGLLGISHDDQEGRAWWRVQNLGNYRAPCVIYILVDRAFYFQDPGVNAWPVFDCGLIAQNIMLLATNFGLGTVVQAEAVRYCDILREALGIPDSKLVLIGISIGYPDWDEKITSFRSDKEPLEKLTKWYGFDSK